MRPRRRTANASEMHRAWLELVDTEGPFLAVPPLKRVWPQGMPQLGSEAKSTLVDAKPAFERAWDAWHGNPNDESLVETVRGARDTWVEMVLRDVIGWGDLLVPIQDAGPARDAHATSPDRRVTVRPTAALRHGDLVGALVWTVDPVESLRELGDDGWSSTPIDRLEAMLRSAGVPIGIVTDGRWWGLVSAPSSGIAASGIVDSQTWVEEPPARDAFMALLDRKHLVGGQVGDRLPALFVESVAAAEEITEALGVQVRRAVELLVNAFSETAAAARRRGDTDPLPDDPDEVYEAAVTVLMRAVFLLFAEERDLLPEGVVFTSGYGLADRYDVLRHRATEEGEESLDATTRTWHRLLATSRALHGGATFEDIRIPAYGGSLFDPHRFPFLEALNDRSTLEVTVSDRVMLHILEAVQVARLRGQDARRISFRDVDVEQIGYIYEGLLGYTCAYADELTVGLIGPPGEEAEIPLRVLDDLAEEHIEDNAIADAIRAWAKDEQPAATLPSKAKLTKALSSGDFMEDAERALLAVTSDEAVRDAVRPWIGVVRRDLRGRPVVVVEGGLLVIETPSRRNAGAHYTPKALAEEVVLHALEPLVYQPGPHQTSDRESWRPISSDAILDLKVADIACGSGAFLVAAARYLAARLVEAWQREGVASGSSHDLEVRALREVVAHCLYGADINGMAVEMCKLSLWLVSLDKRLPFSFVDDKVLHGNSLLGLTDLKQLERLHINPPDVAAETMFDLGTGNELVERLEIDTVIRRVKNLRAQLATVVDNTDPQRSATTKRRLWSELQHVTAQLSKVADGVIAAGLASGGKPGRTLDEAYDNLRIAVGFAYPAKGDGTSGMLEAIIRQGLTPTVETDYERWRPLHWCLAVPEIIEQGGFNSVIGNPPFLGGKKVSLAVGSNLREWLVNILADGVKGNADLVAYFFLRALALLREGGTSGLIATNTIAQGDTREVGLARMIERDYSITRAIQSRRWPTSTVSLEFAAVWGTRGKLPAGVSRVADGSPVRRISSFLEAAGENSRPPVRLIENLDFAFVGSYVNCVDEFCLPVSEAKRLVRSTPSLARYIRPFLSGHDLNQDARLSPSRWIIDVTGVPEEDLPNLGDVYQRLESRVRPARERLTNKPRLQQYWWQYEAPGFKMREKINHLDEVLAMALVSKTVMPVRVSSQHTFSHKIGIFATGDPADLAILSSIAHQAWALKHSSTLGLGLNYSPSDVFLSLPRPKATRQLAELGDALDGERSELMTSRELGLTSVYNLVNDPSLQPSSDPGVDRLRELHASIDEAVMTAYGWGDLSLNHDFHAYRQVIRWTVDPAARVEILDRLLMENHRRAALQDSRPDLIGHDVNKKDVS